MKKMIFILVLLMVLSTVSVFAWQPSDLMLYPPCMDAGSWLLNVGVGFNGNPGNLPKFDSDYYYIPPMHASLDKNVPLSSNKLPFFFGGYFGYWGHGYKGKNKWFYSALNFGARFGYHFNWGVEKLDTYAVTKLGWSVYLGDKKYLPTAFGYPDIGINLGARFFPLSWFGFYAEVGGGSYFSADIGLAFKF